MIVFLNGTKEEVRDSANLAEVIAKVSSAANGIAVALDDQVVPRTAWASTGLVDGARVEVLTAVQGG